MIIVLGIRYIEFDTHLKFYQTGMGCHRRARVGFCLAQVTRKHSTEIWYI